MTASYTKYIISDFTGICKMYNFECEVSINAFGNNHKWVSAEKCHKTWENQITSRFIDAIINFQQLKKNL